MIIRGTVGTNSKLKLGTVFTFRHRTGKNIFVKEFLGEYFYFDLEANALCSMPWGNKLFETVTIHKVLSKDCVVLFKKRLKDKKNVLTDVSET